MASTTTTAIGVRIPNEHAEGIRQQASRFGLSRSQAIATLIAGALALDATTMQGVQGARAGARGPAGRGGSGT